MNHYLHQSQQKLLAGGSHNHRVEASEAECDLRHIDGENVRRAGCKHTLSSNTLCHRPQQPALLPELPGSHVRLLSLPYSLPSDAGPQCAVFKLLQHNHLHFPGTLRSLLRDELPFLHAWSHPAPLCHQPVSED